MDDVISCVAKEKGATPVDAYLPFQTSCTGNDCFSDSLHPDDKGYGLIFDAFRDTPGSPVPATSAPDGTWPYRRPTISDLAETRRRIAPSTAHHKRGTLFSFKLDQPARLGIAIEHSVIITATGNIPSLKITAAGQGTDNVAEVERIKLLELRDEIHFLAAIQRETSDRLSQLLQGAEAVCEDEAEPCWV